MQERKSLAGRSATVALSDPEAVLILVAIIREHGISAEEIAALPEIKKSKIKLATKNVFMSEREVSYLGRKFIIYPSAEPTCFKRISL